MIVATAGHIDHGKTTLVKALTGVDTDRLPEEKARGISIDLGFAYLPLASGATIGFVDVPGHERFIRNMLAGVCGIDYALLVVAADDGIMPQTLEHLQILDLLRIARGAAVITKADRVDVARLAQVTDNVRALIDGTTLKGGPILPVSAIAGTGIPALRALLDQEATRATSRQIEGQRFRLAVDRVFSVPGSGTVATGTVFNGQVRVGDKLLVSPAGREVRVRGLQKRGTSAESAVAGERCALNLTGTDLDGLGRGDWVLAPELHHPTRRIDARVTVLPSEAHALKHWTPAHLHLATSDVTARIAIRRGAALAPGESAIVQLILDQPVTTLRGDRFILRDQSAMRTLGGGIIIDPHAPATRRSTPARRAELAAFEQADPAAALAQLAATADCAIELTRFETLYNLTPDRAKALYDAAGLVALGREPAVGITRTRRDALAQAVVQTLAAFHQAQPQATGIEIETLRTQTAPTLGAEPFAALLRELADARKLEVNSNLVRQPGHNATANSADEKLWQIVKPALENAGYTAPPVKDLALELKQKEAILRDFLHRKAKSGEVHRVTPERFYARSTLAALAAIAQNTARAHPAGFTAAQYRDATGTGRSLAIEILEHLDRIGITQRLGDARKMRRDYEPILGPAPELRSPPPRAAAPARPATPSPARRPVPGNHYRRR